LLLDAGADVRALSPGALAPLHHAVYHGREHIVAVLLSRGAQAADTFSLEAAQLAWEHRFPAGGTALHMAALILERDRAVIAENGDMAPVIVPNFDDALKSSRRRASIVKQLIAAGVNVHARTPDAVRSRGSLAQNRMSMTAAQAEREENANLTAPDAGREKW